MAEKGLGARGSVSGRAVSTVAALALVASAAFSIGELSGAHRAGNGNAPASGNAPSAAASGASGLSGLSLSGLQSLESQVSQAAAIAKGLNGSNGSDGTSADIAQLEQQLGISPTSSPQSQAEQLQSELDAINACLSGSTATSSAC